MFVDPMTVRVEWAFGFISDPCPQEKRPHPRACMSHLLDQLNPQQRQAVEAGPGPMLILAGAGSGKTRVITYRIAYLIEAQAVAPDAILAVTFTNKAAEQMRVRVGALISKNLEAWPHISTFHSFCVAVLRQHFHRLGRAPGFSIYDEDDQRRIMKACVDELGLSEQIASPAAALARISYAKNRGWTPADLYREAQDPVTEKMASLFDLYQRKLGEANAVDFDDLLLKAVELFERAPEVCERYNRRFQYILVDEYQDTNRVQYELIQQLTRLHQNVCAVGDEDQSIYHWRGADIVNILGFEKDYPGTRLIRLEQNYRSTQRILDAATSVVSRNAARKGKTLWTDRGSGERVALVEAQDAEGEGLFVAREIARVLAQEPAQTVGVLYRTNAQSRLLEEAMRHAGVDYRVVGASSFYARAEIRDALAYARLATNLRDQAAFLRVINSPSRGIGETTLGKIQEAAHRGRLSLFEALEAELAAQLLPSRALRTLESFYELMQELAAGAGRLSIPEFFRNLLEQTRIREVFEAQGTPDAESRLENLRELVNAGAEASERGETLSDFLDHATLVSEADDYDERARVTLMTLHSAKGLEFSTVFLVGL
jgi:DNA helicase-2/ATP-dependent DNA helicase PcrA